MAYIIVGVQYTFFTKIIVYAALINGSIWLPTTVCHTDTQHYAGNSANFLAERPKTREWESRVPPV